MLETTTKPCRHGVFTFYDKDRYVGKSLSLYGDYSEDECSVFSKVLRPDDVAIEIGSNIGSLTVPMAKLCKKVYAFEPQPDNFRLLTKNIVDNNLDNVVLSDCALGSSRHVAKICSLEHLGHDNFGNVELGGGDIMVEVVKLDDLHNIEETIKFIKIDAEGMERDILQGAEQTIRRHRPLLYVENDRKEKSAELVGWLIDHGYRCFWHRSPLYIQQNFRGEKTNVFGHTIALNMICIPEERDINVSRLEEVDDHRVDAQMYHREKARALRRLAKSGGSDLESRVISAHYCNLMGDEDNASKLIEENLARNPHDVGTLAVKALMDLQGGRFKEGWQGYELRYQHIAPDKFGFRPHAEPHWDGSPTDEIVLVWCEQGFGDSIMFGRFMDEVLKRAPNAILEVQPQLYEMFKISNIMPQGQLFRLGRTMPKYAYHCSLPSVPSVLRLEHEAQVTRGKYLFGDKAMVAGWKERATPRIGICLTGGTYSERAYSRDMPRKWGDQLADEFGPFMSLANEGQWESYADTAAAIEALDLVLTVDTSVAHLSGALGVPTYLMLSSDPDWRWQRQRNDSPWYPSMTIFRQKQFLDWSTVIAEIAEDMRLRKLKAA